MEFTAIPGVGEKTAAALAELDDAERALREGDVAALAAAPGLSAGRAAAVARAAVRHEHGADDEFLATDRARDVFESVLSLLQARTVTDYAARRLETFVPTGAPSRIEEVRALVERATSREIDEATIDALAAVEPLAAPVFAALATLHEHGLAHGDLRAENLLVVDGDPYFIDATKVRADAVPDARAYDVASALAVFAPVLGAGPAVEAALSVYPVEVLLAAREFLDFVSVRPDHGFDAAAVKGEIEKRAA